MLNAGSSASPASTLVRASSKLSEPSEGSREMKMCVGIVSVCVETTAQPHDRFCVALKVHFGEADPYYPLIGKIIARRKTKCLADVSFCFFASAKQRFSIADESMGRAKLGSNASACSHSAIA